MNVDTVIAAMKAVTAAIATRYILNKTLDKALMVC